MKLERGHRHGQGNHEDLETRLAQRELKGALRKLSMQKGQLYIYVVLHFLFSCAGMPECQFQLAK